MSAGDQGAASPKVVVARTLPAARTARDAMAQLCADNVIAVLSGAEPPTPVV